MAITKIHLLNVPLENDYKNTLYFESAAVQEQYFLGRVARSYTDCTYQRKDNIIRVNAVVDDIYNCNYVMYQNTAYSNKWFYAFITDLKYINDERTDVTIETDVIQTWLFNYTVKESFVEREHVSDDTIGLHTIPEGLETGEYVVNDWNKCDGFSSAGYVIGCTVDISWPDEGILENKYPNVGGDVYNGIYSGIKYYYLTVQELKIILKRLADKGQADAVTCLFVVPATLFETINDVYHPIKASTIPTFYQWGSKGGSKIEKPTKINGYTPKNNKLFTFPYSYLMVDNNAGSAATYKYEMFSTNNCGFTISAALTPGLSIKIEPEYYNGSNSVNISEGLVGAKFPICNWNTDVYTNWLTQNSVNIQNDLAFAGIQVIGGAIATVATGGTLGAVGGAAAIVNGLQSISNTMTQIYQHSFTPPTVSGNLNSGDVMFSGLSLMPIAYSMSIKQEYAKIIDKYFTMFGYKVNSVKLPNKTHRSRFWYTKTIDVNIDGNINNKDLQVIKNCYNNGITFWRSAAGMNDYTTTNAIV